MKTINDKDVKINLENERLLKDMKQAEKDALVGKIKESEAISKGNEWRKHFDENSKSLIATSEETEEK